MGQLRHCQYVLGPLLELKSGNNRGGGAAGKSLAFLPSRCFFGLFGVSLCASCSVDCVLFLPEH